MMQNGEVNTLETQLGSKQCLEKQVINQVRSIGLGDQKERPLKISEAVQLLMTTWSRMRCDGRQKP